MRISDWSSDVCSSDLFFDMVDHDRGVAIGFADAAEREAASGDGHRHMARHGKRDDVADLEREQLDETDFGAREHRPHRSEEHTSELQSLMRISYAVFCLKKQKTYTAITKH